MSYEEDYNQIRRLLKEGVGGPEKDEVFWMVLEGVAEIIDDVAETSLKKGVSAGQKVYNAIKGKKKTDPTCVPNPWFVWNGHDDNPTKYTRQYLKNRKWKGRGAKAIQAAGGLAQAVTMVDVGTILTEANALGSTGFHLVKFAAMAKSYRQTKTISDWLNVIIRMKALKAGVRTAGLLGAAIPIPMAGTITGVLAKAATLGAKLTMTKVCLATAADLHWRSYQELVVGSAHGGGKGPAMRIMKELFVRRGGTRVFGQYDLTQIIREPNGWLCVNDKLMLI